MRRRDKKGKLCQALCRDCRYWHQSSAGTGIWFAWKKRAHDGWMTRPEYARDKFMEAAELAYSFRVQLSVLDSAVLPSGHAPSKITTKETRCKSG